MPSNTRNHLGPDFEDFTMTSENFRWLHSCRWEASHSTSFLKLRTAFPHSFGKAPNLVKSKTFHSPLTSAQWLLVDQEEKPLAWAEVQSFPYSHDKYGILMWGRAESETGAFDEMHITRLISFSFIVGKFDHMKIASSAPNEQSILESLAKGVGEIRRTIALTRYAWHPSQKSPFVELKTLEVAREEWIASPTSDAANKTLQHVHARIKSFERAQIKPKRKRRSLLARLLRPKIDDTLF